MKLRVFLSNSKSRSAKLTQLHQALVLHGVHLPLVRWEDLRVERPAVPGRLLTLTQRLQHRQTPSPPRCVPRPYASAARGRPRRSGQAKARKASPSGESGIRWSDPTRGGAAR